MDFYDVLDQVLILLKRHGRVTYQALKRQFDLEDACLEDLQGELLFGHPVNDENGCGLVWTGTPAEREIAVQSETEGESLTHTSCAAKKNSSKTFSKCLLFSFAEAAVQPRK